MNLAGTLLLFYSFQATSSSFRLVKRQPSGLFSVNSEYSICVEDYTLMSTDARGGVVIGHRGCPTSQDDRRAAVVNTEHPTFITIGFFLIFFGFMILFFSVPEPKTIAQLRYEIKMLKIKERAGGENQSKVANVD
jgi:hypothetical protein